MHSTFTPVMSIVATLQPLVGAAHTLNVTVNMQLGDIRNEAAELMEWHNADEAVATTGDAGTAVDAPKEDGLAGAGGRL